MNYVLNTFGQAYGAGAYGSSTYQNGTTTAAGTTGTNGTSGALTNTGFDLVLAATVACVIIFTALVIRFWKRPRKHAAGD